MASRSNKPIARLALVGLAAALLLAIVVGCDAKLLARSRYYDEGYGYADSMRPYGPRSTGERAILSVRGARSPFDGSAPSKIAIEDDPYRGPFPRGVYDRLDSGYGGARYPMRLPGLHSAPMRADPYGYGQGPYGGGYGGSMYGAPSRIAVTGAFPYGYGSRF